ncbi:hypothetical protein LCGC14_0830170 [marine sediment metagenome]|uniref:Uncharacterized protein n=1 Tax=marine sediment metagenome TaxID=412755 RepID=A0A0F9PKZ0_9ZZZZ
MADRILTWYIENPKNTGSEGATYCLDRSYSLPGMVRVYAGDAPGSAELQVDIKDDGVSIFTNLPSLQKGENELDWWEDFNDDLSIMAQYSWVSLEIPQFGGAKRITVVLELQYENAELPQDDED